MPSVSERVKVALLALATLVVVVLWGYLLTHTPKGEPFTPPANGAGATTPAAAAALRVTVVGGAFTAPTTYGGRGQNGWPEIVGSSAGWQTTVFADDGAGYLTAGVNGHTLPGFRPQIATSRPDLVLIAGGRADVGQNSAAAIATAARDFIGGVRADLPSARILVLGPVATDETAPAGATQVRDALRTTLASLQNTTFIDPLAENWFANAPSGAIATDGQHPTDVGHRLIADRLRADLTRLGILPNR